MQSKFTLINKRLFFLFIPALLLLFSFITFSSNAQTYVNGVLSTGANSISGVAAPAGTTWSECQNPTGNTTIANTNAGFGAQITANNAVADDFVVTGTWNVTKITVYAYSTGYTGSTSPFNDLRIRIHNSSPLAGPTTIVFGDLTTNRLSASSFTNVYRIFNTVVAPATPPGTTRMIWRLEANVSVSLSAGTYWLEYQTGTSLTSNFTPPSSPIGVRTLPGYNALQRIGTAWAALGDAGSGPAAPANVACDMPFIIDYTTGACSGTPVPGNTVTSATSVCPVTSFTLSLQNSTPGSGVTYQWQSASSATGPWSNISGATSPTYATTLTATTWFQCIVTCSGNSGTSNPVQVMLAPPSGCYCTAGATSTSFEKISRVQFNTIDNPSTSTAGYENFTTISTTVIKGQVIPLTVTISGPFSSDQIFAWIDFNQNGSFTDPGEQVYTSPQGVGPHTGNVTIPTTALTGTTRMRIRLHDAADGPNSAPCGNSTYGQVEDYNVSIQPCVNGVFTTHPTNKSVQCSGTTTFTTVNTGSALTYQWEVNDLVSGWQNLSNGGVYSGATTSTLTLTNVPATMNGYRYKVAVVGPCTGISISDSATLTVTPLVATVNPTSATICAGSIQALTLTNATSPATVSFTNNTPLPIPDNDPAGVLSSIAVSGIPTGAVVTNISVRFNIPAHTWVGDLDINLIAPNNVNMNLVGSLNNGTGSNGTTGFVNTVISSTSTTPISGAAAPRTGTFAAERRNGYGPTGNTQTSAATNWPDLITTLNGNWRLAIADFGPADIGTLTNWTIIITYGAPVTGLWTSNPASPNTMFTDMAASVPYTGGQATTIYVKPTVNTIYSVVYSTATPCTSGVTNIPVNVVNPVSSVVNPVDRSVCVGGNTSFTVGASGGPIAYQWQVSSDGGANYNNISGATSATLNLTNVSQSMNNYRYRVTLSAAPCTGTTTTPFALLTVNPLPAVTITAAPVTALRPQLTTTITAASTPAGASYSWTFNGATLTGATGSSVVATVDGIGSYTATVTDVNGCVNTSSPLAITGLYDNRLFISPNPAPNGQFRIRAYSGVNFDYRTVSVYNSSGMKVFKKLMATSGPWQKLDIDLSGVPSGVYVVVLSDGFDTKRVVGKVVVQR